MYKNKKLMTAKTMKAMVASGYGNAEVYSLQEVEIPQPKSNQVQVKVHAASVTTADTMIRTGKPYIGRLFMGLIKPKNPIPGTGFAGVVTRVGSEVSSFKEGDRVFGESLFNFSTNAEYLVCDEEGVILPMSDSMDFIDAANFCDGQLTSYNFLKEIADLKKDQKILINGASGALGLSAVQIAKFMGAHVTGVCSSKNFGLVRSMGADELIDYNQTDFTEENTTYDFVYDTLGYSSFQKCKKVLAEEGAYLSPVISFGLLLQVIKTSFSGKQKAKFEATGSNSASKLKKLMAEAHEIYKAGKLKMVIDRQFPLEKLVEAHHYIEGGHKKGNVVIINS
jgi:NADPH:quinone reductase-like Zn-dependent oxidoreductase